MRDPSLALQKSVYGLLTASADLMAAFGADAPRVYDRVPLDQAGRVTAKFPYVHIGEDHIVSDADQCHDKSSAYATVHVWSRAPGKVEAKTIMAAVCLALDVIPPLEGFQAVAHLVDSGPLHMTDADGLTAHSVVTFHYRLAPVA